MLHRNPITINTLYKGTLSPPFRWELPSDAWRLLLFYLLFHILFGVLHIVCGVVGLAGPGGLDVFGRNASPYLMRWYYCFLQHQGTGGDN